MLRSRTESPRRLAKSLAFLWLLSIMLLPGSARAQFDSASVLGAVKDPTGAAVPGASVALRDVAKGVVTTQRAGNDGQYEFLNVSPGQYVVKITADGFEGAQTDPFVVTVSARQRVDLNLKLGAASDVVTVNGAATLLQTETSDRGATIQGTEAVALPLNGRSYADLTTLVPGVRKSLLENNAFPPRDASYDVNGLASVYNNFQLDGIDNNAYQEANQGYSSEAMVPSPDAIQEFNVQTDNYSAEYGRAGGAIINATTKSGTNAFHGGAYDYLRNTVLNAYGPFIGLGVKPTLVQNQFGGTIGGRIIRDRIFFFADYEGLRADSKTLTQAELPTAAEHAGTFTVDGTANNTGTNVIPVKNPYTGAVYTNGQVPLTDPNINPLSVLILKELPLPNIPGAALTANNYQYMGPNTTNDNKGDGRLDFFLSPRQTGFARYSQRAVTYFTAPPIPGLAGGNSNGYLSAHTRQIALGYNFSPSPTSVLEVRFGYTSTQASKQAIDFGQANVLAGLGFPNVPNNPQYTSGINSQSVTGFSAFGGQATSPQFQSPTQYNPKVNYSFVRGHHSLKIGYEYGWLAQAVDDFNPVFGSDAYAGKFSAATSATTQQAANLTDFLFGARNNYSLNNIAEVHLERFWHMGYIQDDWKPLPNLTINAGLRYEFVSPNLEKDNHILNYDPVNNRILHAGNGADMSTSAYTIHYTGDGSLAARGLVNPDYKDFGPRLGFSYQVRPGTVIRSGFGISYAYLFRFGDEGMLAYNGPDIVDATINQTPSQGLCTSLTQDPSTCFRRTQDGYQTNFATAQNYGSTKAETRYQPANFKTPYVESWHLSVQQQLPLKTTLEISYVGNHGVQIPTLYDLNEANLCTQAQVTANNCPSLLSRRPIPGFTDILTESNAGFLSFNSLQTKLEHRFAQGLFLTNSFTWERALSNSAADGEATNSTGDSAVVNYRNIAGDRGPATYNQPLNDTLSVIGDLPYGRGKQFGKNANGVEQAFLGGWQLTAINIVTSGLPINLTYIPATNVQVSTTSVLYSLRPNLVSTNAAVYGHKFVKSNTNVSGYLNSSAVSVPTGSQLFGNAGRNSLRGPAFGQLDLAAHKSFNLGSEARTLQFRIEAFNVLNATNFAQPDTTLTDGANFGTFSSALTSLFPSRQVQLALRFSF
ncbi:hypothetical protein FTO74_06700 [Granulicella sp. WH15]|nr:hypothetical protein FTO74_06700 [Granulicella sp. WH15]